MRLRRRAQVKYQIRWALIPGKHDTSPEENARIVRAMVDEFDLDFVGTTEFQSAGTLAAVRDVLGKGWRVAKVGEYVGAWRTSTLRARVHADGHDVAILRRFSDVEGLPDWQNVFAGIFRLVHVATGRPFTGVVFHSNSGIEMGDGFRKGAGKKVESSRTGLGRIGAWAKARFRAHARLLVLIMGDGNLNQFRGRWRTYMKRLLGGLSVWEESQNTIGDHGSRLIVVAHVYGRKVIRFLGRVIKRNEVRYPTKFDHCSLVGALDFTSNQAA